MKLIKNKIEDPVKYIKQMTYELEIICNAGFAGYSVGFAKVTILDT